MSPSDQADFSIELSEENDECSKTEDEEDIRLQIIRKLFKLFIRHKWTLKALEDASALLNSMPNTTIQLPTTKYRLLKELINLVHINIIQYFHCVSCDQYTKCDYTDSKKPKICVVCNQRFKKEDFLIHFGVKEQIKVIIDKNFQNILQYCSSIEDSGDITDTYNANFIKTIRRRNANVFSVILNTDGVATVRSNTSSLWPILLICNFLPPRLRFKDENIIVAALYHGKEKPPLHEYFQPVAVEFEHLSSAGIFIRDRYFKIAVTHAVLDLPAKALLSQMMQYNSARACISCLHPGERTRRGIRYTYKNYSKLRTHSSMLNDMKGVNERQKVINGMKGVSPMIAFEYFDMSKSFVTDYMHGALLGITNNMILFWTSTKNKKKPSYINKKNRAIFNSRLLQIRPPSYISRRPRSLQYLKFFKAAEFRSLLLYYLPVVLERLLPSKYIHHLCLLSSSVYTLLKEKISNAEMLQAEDKLKLFVKQYQEYYGEVNMTMNIHSLLHLVDCVRDFGPLWTYSMFAFESYNGVLKSFIVAPTDILHQITIRYACYKMIETNKEIDECFRPAGLKDVTVFTLEPRYMEAIEEAGVLPVNGEDLKYYAIYEKNGIRFTSKIYTRAKTTMDYFVSVADGSLGVVQFYFESNSEQYAVLETVEMYETTYQFSKFHFTGEYIVIQANVIVERHLYIQVMKQNIIVKRPNSIERN